MTRLLTVNDAARMLGVHPNTVRARLRELGAVDLNHGKSAYRMIRIPEHRVLNYIAKGEMEIDRVGAPVQRCRSSRRA